MTKLLSAIGAGPSDEAPRSVPTRWSAGDRQGAECQDFLSIRVPKNVGRYVMGSTFNKLRRIDEGHSGLIEIETERASCSVTHLHTSVCSTRFYSLWMSISPLMTSLDKTDVLIFQSNPIQFFHRSPHNARPRSTHGFYLHASRHRPSAMFQGLWSLTGSQSPECAREARYIDGRLNFESY